jgi:Fe-S-cluster containining protein
VRSEITLKFDELLNLAKTHGICSAKAGFRGFSLQKKDDGSCRFLSRINGLSICELQNMKPKACRLWPFKVLKWPKYGRAREALFNYKERRFFIYIDPSCPAIGWGKPMANMLENIIPEFIKIA